VRGGDRGAAGKAETAEALAQGRVEHLLIHPALADAEGMIEMALETSARVTQVDGDGAADALAQSDGVAALLRY
jgi:hypothetical protein